MTLDCRGQGSLYFNDDITADAEDWQKRLLVSSSVSDLYDMLYGNTSSLTEWDNSFYNVSSFRNTGYIALLQQYLAAKGTCLITMGGGEYQSNARELFKTFHPGNNCILDIPMP